ncbi:MAG: hypothetical protein ACRD0G_07455 [Acidimicrobiales bacterium]
MNCRSLALSLLVPLVGVAGGPSTSPAGRECQPIVHVDTLLATGTVVLVGELHGTAESPAFVGAVACHAVDAGLDVSVALEIPTPEDDRIQTFLDSDGTADDRSELLDGSFWQAGEQDGRSSEAMAALLDRLRALRAAGLPVEVVLLDDTTGRGSGDQALAERLVAAADANEAGLVVSLTGNVHNPVVRGTEWDPDFEPMGYLAAQQLEPGRIVALDVASAGGSAWVCVDECGVHEFEGDGQDVSKPVVELHEELDDSGFHGVYHIGEITASPPAVAPTGGS